MPRNVRNFWLDGTIDGQKTRLAGGPPTTNGGFRLMLYMRSNGCVSYIGSLEGRCNEADVLTLTWVTCNSQRCLVTTQR